MAEEPPELNQPSAGELNWHVPLNENFGDTEDAFHFLYPELDGLDDRLGFAEDDLNTLETDLSALETDVSSLETDVSSLETDVAGKADSPHGNLQHDPEMATKQEHDELQTQVDSMDPDEGAPDPHDNEYHEPNMALEGDLNALATDLNALETDHDTLSSEYDSHTLDEAAHHTRYDDDEARSAVDGSNVSVAHADDADDAENAEDSFLWDGYELVVDDEEPTTDKYIRLETE